MQVLARILRMIKLVLLSLPKRQREKKLRRLKSLRRRRRKRRAKKVKRKKNLRRMKLLKKSSMRLKIKSRKPRRKNHGTLKEVWILLRPLEIPLVTFSMRDVIPMGH